MICNCSILGKFGQEVKYVQIFYWNSALEYSVLFHLNLTD